jgi:hypothetical protein
MYNWLRTSCGCFLDDIKCDFELVPNEAVVEEREQCARKLRLVLGASRTTVGGGCSDYLALGGCHRERPVYPSGWMIRSESNVA